MKSGNACYHLVQNFSCTIVLSKDIKIKIHRTITLPIVFYGCESWSLLSREERRLGVLENWVPRRIFGPKRDEVKAEWIKPHNEEIIDLYSQNIIWVENEMGGAGSTYGERRGA